MCICWCVTEINYKMLSATVKIVATIYIYIYLPLSNFFKGHYISYVTKFVS